MAVTNLRALVNKLNANCRRGLEGAAGLCMSRTNYNVEVEHWLLKLLEPTNTDLTRLLRQYGADTAKATRELTRVLDGLRTGNARRPEMSPDIPDLMREAWVLASLEFGSPRIRSGHLLTALLSDRSLSARLRGNAPELAKINVEQLQKELNTVTSGSVEDEPEPGDVGETTGPGQQPRADSKTPRSTSSPTTLPTAPGRATLTPSSAATSRSARSSTSSRAAARTTRSSPARRASARPRSSRASPWRSSPATCRRR
jgi:type VI secretion system protein VasG